MNYKASVKEYYKAQSGARAKRLERPGLNLHREIYEEHTRLFRSLISGEAPYGRGLDIGAGPGVWAEFLADYCESVLGIDFVEENVAIAANSAARRNLADRVSYQIGDAEDLEGVERASFELAAQVSVLQHLPNKRKALETAYAVLKPGGRFLLLAQNRRCLYNTHQRDTSGDSSPVGINEYSELNELKATLEAIGFRIETVRPCWLLFRDLLHVGTEHRILRWANPLRVPFLYLFRMFETSLNRFPRLTPLFREIVILARKPGN